MQSHHRGAGAPCDVHARKARVERGLRRVALLSRRRLRLRCRDDAPVAFPTTLALTCCASAGGGCPMRKVRARARIG